MILKTIELSSVININCAHHELLQQGAFSLTVKWLFVPTLTKMHRNCINEPHNFCYVYGQFIGKMLKRRG